MASKVKVLWTPEGGSPKSWTFDTEAPPWDVMSQTERATDWPWEEFAERLGKGSIIAVQALLWVLRKRDEPHLTLDAVRPFDPTQSLIAELDFEYVEDEPPARKKDKDKAATSGEA